MSLLERNHQQVRLQDICNRCKGESSITEEQSEDSKTSASKGNDDCDNTDEEDFYEQIAFGTSPVGMFCCRMNAHGTTTAMINRRAATSGFNPTTVTYLTWHARMTKDVASSLESMRKAFIDNAEKRGQRHGDS